MRVDPFSAPLWAGAGVLAAAETAGVGALAMDASEPAARTALCGAIGAAAIGTFRCALDAAVPPPGDNAALARAIIFTFSAVTFGPVLGAKIGSCCGLDPPDGRVVLPVVGLLGATVTWVALAVPATVGFAVRTMFAAD